MPVISSPKISSTPRGHRVSASYEFNGADPNKVPADGFQVLGIPLDAVEIFSLAIVGVQGAAQIGAIKTVQLSFKAFPTEGPPPDVSTPGFLQVVCDTQQVFVFEIVQLAAPVIGAYKTGFTAIFPVEANASSNFQFVMSLGNFQNISLGLLWINLFDYDLPPFYAGSNAVIS
jgi:hypothetical protein